MGTAFPSAISSTEYYFTVYNGETEREESFLTLVEANRHRLKFINDGILVSDVKLRTYTYRLKV